MAVVTRCTIKNCILTAKDDLEPYWMVEFDQQYTVAAVEFISAEKSSEENNGKGKICVYVSGILADWSKTLVLHQNKVKQQMKNKTETKQQQQQQQQQQHNNKKQKTKNTRTPPTTTKTQGKKNERRKRQQKTNKIQQTKQQQQ